MDAATILNITTAVIGAVGEAIRVGPLVFKTIDDAKPFVRAIIQSLMGREPTPEEQSMLEAHLDALSDQLQTPLPPKQDDDI